MSTFRARALALVVCSLLLVSSQLEGKTANTSDASQRQRAMLLFSEGNRLEALPILEELSAKNPKDDEVLVALAACLVEHAATLNDPGAAAKERFRARDVLQKAWALGNTTPLAENLRQLLDELPANGSIEFSDNPEVEEAMSTGEAAFARRDFDEALKGYAQALQIEPTNYYATLFTANTYDKGNDFAQAADWYQRAIKLNPNIETAYRYYADMLAKQGDMGMARSMLIQAAIAEPYNKIVWREIRAWAIINKTTFKIVYVAIPRPTEAESVKNTGPLPEISSAWHAYYSVKSEWESGGGFRKQFPQEEYRHSLAEEFDALSAAAKVLEKMKQSRKGVEMLSADSSAILLMKLHEAHLLEPYVLFSLGDDGIAKDYSSYRAKNREKLETYLDTFVMPPAPAKP